MKRWIRITLAVVFSLLLLLSVWKIYDIQHAYQVGEEAYSKLEQYISFPEKPAASPDTQTAPPHKTDEEVDIITESIDWPQVDFAQLTQINPEVVGWIYVEGTNINYPIVQAADNNYYLTRLFDGTYNSSGSIFLDASAASDFSDRHSIIFGHHMKNNTMFSALMDYKDPAFYQAHPNVLLLTPTRNYRVQLFSGYVTDLSVNSWEREFTDIRFEDWLSDLISRSDFSAVQYPTAKDRIVTLSTCTYEYADAKYTLHGYVAYSEEVT